MQRGNTKCLIWRSAVGLLAQCKTVKFMYNGGFLCWWRKFSLRRSTAQGASEAQQWGSCVCVGFPPSCVSYQSLAPRTCPSWTAPVRRWFLPFATSVTWIQRRWSDCSKTQCYFIINSYRWSSTGFLKIFSWPTTICDLTNSIYH
jgi:hypothetical protein